MAASHSPKPVPLAAVATAAQAKPAEADRPAPAAALELPGVGNIDKIRDIIFGNQMRDHEKRFVRLEERLMKESSELRDAVKRRLEQLEAHSRYEPQTLAERLKAEHDERAGADHELRRDLRELGQAGDKKMALLDEQAVKSGRDLRQQLLEQSRQLADDLRHTGETLSATIAREAHELRGDKTDRAALAGLFTEMALRLSHELQSPAE
jgi:hypothetical protein